MKDAPLAASPDCDTANAYLVLPVHLLQPALGDIETAMRCNIAIAIIVMNNRAFGSKYHLQQHHNDGRIISEIIDFYDSDSAVARASGPMAFRITRTVSGALRETSAANKPALVVIMTSKECRLLRNPTAATAWFSQARKRKAHA